MRHGFGPARHQLLAARCRHLRIEAAFYLPLRRDLLA
jgi:hypothetical protein